MVAHLGTVKEGNELMIPEPMRVKVGQEYELHYQGKIIPVVIKKIVTDSAHVVQGVVVEKSADKGLLRHIRREAISISASELKTRLLSGGLKEAIIV